jgi:hypothetical protein
MNIIYKLKNFAYSLFWHIYRGFPKSSQQLIRERYNICKYCEWFDKESSQCLVCGCNINEKKIFMNKLAWADQKCPEKKW